MHANKLVLRTKRKEDPRPQTTLGTTETIVYIKEECTSGFGLSLNLGERLLSLRQQLCQDVVVLLYFGDMHDRDYPLELFSLRIWNISSMHPKGGRMH